MIRATWTAWLQRADLQIDVGLGDAQVAEERRGERVVVVLACVHDDLSETRGLGRAMNRREFREVRTGSDDVEQLHRIMGVRPGR